VDLKFIKPSFYLRKIKGVLALSYNQKKTSHTFTQNNQNLIDQEKMTTRKGSGFQFSIVYEAYTRAWE
jgi:hypothetical protein